MDEREYRDRREEREERDGVDMWDPPATWRLRQRNQSPKP
jgi:hypothetical protein